MRTRLIGLVAAFAAVAVIIAGCSAQSTQRDPVPTVSASVAAATESCDPAADHSQAVAVARAALPLQDRVTWSDRTPAQSEPCAELSYLVAQVEAPTVSSPEIVMFFSRGQFVGLANPCAYLITGVVDVDGDKATVEYRFQQGSEPQAGLRGREKVTYRYDSASGTLSNSGYSTALQRSQPTCDAATGTWEQTPSTSTAVPSAPAATTRDSSSCIADLEIDLVVPTERYSNGAESDGSPRYIVRIRNAGESACDIRTADLTLTVGGRGQAVCHPEVGSLSLAAGAVSNPLDSMSGVWGTCATSAITGSGEYELTARVSRAGVTAVSSTQNFTVS